MINAHKKKNKKKTEINNLNAGPLQLETLLSLLRETYTKQRFIFMQLQREFIFNLVKGDNKINTLTNEKQ